MPMLATQFGSTWPVALEIAWKSAAILGTACAVSLLLWRATAALRHAVWVLALGSLLLLPALEMLLPAWRPAAPPRAQTPLSAGPLGVTAVRGAAQPHASLPLTQPNGERRDSPW